MSAANRRTSTRILSEFPVTLFNDKGEAVDPHAVAHDLSDKGFKVEARVELKVGQLVSYRLSIEAGELLTGRARIVWCQRTDLSYWGGAQFLNLSWSDRKRVRRATRPDGLNWDGIADKAIIALSVLLVTLVGWTAMHSPAWRALLGHMVPEAFAALLMGLALRELLRWR
jgi:hypothetical protein